MPKSNDEILSEYKARFYAVMDSYVDKAVDEQPDATRLKDAFFLMECVHVIDCFLANPEKPLLQVKLSFDLDDYKDRYNYTELMGKLRYVMNFFGKWKPGALFI